MSDRESIEREASVEAALRAFSEGRSMEERSLGLKRLMKGGAIHAVRDDSRFAEGVKEALREVRSGGDPGQKLPALTAVARIASRIKAMRGELACELASALHGPLPELSELGDAEDRAYAAQALEWAPGSWMAPYAARAIVAEEAGEKARAALVRVLLRRAPDLSTAFGTLREPLAKWRPDTEAPGDSVARRLKRILSATRKEIVLGEYPPGDDVGAAVERLVKNAFFGAGPPESPGARAEIVCEITLFLHDLVRTRFSLATESSTYGALRVASRWFVTGRWPEKARKPLAVLSRDIEEAIALLARQGITDNDLLKSLVLVEGTRGNALKITSRIAERFTGLPKETSEWLRRGRVGKKARGTESALESGLLAADRSLALLLIDSGRLAATIDGPGRDLLDDVRVFKPDMEKSAEALLNRAKAVAGGVRSLAGKRSLRMRGEAGEVVDYSPIEHEGIAGPMAGARRVRIVQPLVERVRVDNVSEVVLKAAVEPERRRSAGKSRDGIRGNS